MIVALIALQLAGLAGLYLVLRRRIERSARGGADGAAQLRAAAAALIVELNGAAERNVSLVEDRIVRLRELLQQADRSLSPRPPEPQPGSSARPPEEEGAATPERVAQVMRLRRLGFSSEVIADRVAASAGEVELIVSLAADRGAPRPLPAAAKPPPRAT